MIHRVDWQISWFPFFPLSSFSFGDLHCQYRFHLPVKWTISCNHNKSWENYLSNALKLSSTKLPLQKQGTQQNQVTHPFLMPRVKWWYPHQKKGQLMTFLMYCMRFLTSSNLKTHPPVIYFTEKTFFLNCDKKTLQLSYQMLRSNTTEVQIILTLSAATKISPLKMILKHPPNCFELPHMFVKELFHFTLIITLHVIFKQGIAASMDFFLSYFNDDS